MTATCGRTRDIGTPHAAPTPSLHLTRFWYDPPAMRLTGRPLVEYVAVAAAVLCALFSAAPAFLRNLRASRMTEPMERLAYVAGRATAIAAGRPLESAYPGSAPLTPSVV